MSRALKFRVWSEEDREYRTDCRLTELFTSETGTPATVYSDEGDRFDIEQYTGLKDKNGKEIYEGDIVRLYEHDWWDGKIVKHHKNPKIEGNFVVYYNDDTASFEMENTQPYEDNGIRGVEPFGFASQEYEVIGNIHENPELLGGEE